MEQEEEDEKEEEKDEEEKEDEDPSADDETLEPLEATAELRRILFFNVRERERELILLLSVLKRNCRFTMILF